MYNFYQSSIRKKLNKDIYRKPVGDTVLFGHTYQYIIREKKKRGLSLCWIQILGINGLQEHSLKERRQELKDITDKHKPFFIQLGSIDILAVSTPEQYKNDDYTKTLYNKRKELEMSLIQQGFTLSTKENLPPSSYVVDLQEGCDTIRHSISSSHQTKIKKAQKKGVLIKEATAEDYNSFSQLLQNTGKSKGFSAVSGLVLHNLLEYGKTNGTIKLYIATLDSDIIAGAVYIYDKEANIGVYLYGATDRKYNNIGASHLLHREARHLLNNIGVISIDLLGGGPTGYKNHHLANVGFFKEGFGGRKVDYIGSFDIIYKPFIYTIWGILRSLQKRIGR